MSKKGRYALIYEMNINKQSTQQKSNKVLPIRQWFYNYLQMVDWSEKKRNMLSFCLISLATGLFTGSICALEQLMTGNATDRINYIISRSTINFNLLVSLYEKWVIRFVKGLSRLSGTEIWLSIDDTLQNKDKRSKCIVKGGKRNRKEGFSFVTAVIGVGNFFIPLIPRQSFRKTVAESLGREYIPKTRLAENLIDTWSDYGLKGQSVVILVDSWYSGKRMIEKCSQHEYALICAFRSNRKLNNIQLKRYQTGVRKYERVEKLDDKYLYRLYTRYGTLSGIKRRINVCLSQRISLSNRKKTWRYIGCIGLNLSAPEILDWYKKRWAVETFHQLWKTFFGTGKWRLQSTESIDRLAIATVLAIGFAIFSFVRRHNYYIDLYELSLEHNIMSMSMTQIKEELIFKKGLMQIIFQKGFQ